MPLRTAEDAVATIGGLTNLLSYVNDVASAADMAQLRDSVGFGLNAIGHECVRAETDMADLARHCCHLRGTQRCDGAGNQG